ncbi:MAG: serine/threonine-protein kinase, partial [Nannocystaceae bacterium]
MQTPESSSGFDLEADRLRALMRASVFKQKFQPVTVDRFEIVRLLGSGAMGIVYEAIDPRDGEHVALKTLRNHNPRALSLFKKEFRALSQLSHPNLVTLYELGREHKKYFFTMELVRGIALQKYLWGLDVQDADPDASINQAGLSASGSITGLTMSPVTDIVRLRDVFGQLAAGLLALHHAGKLHRDIKPTNVLVTPRGRVVLMDFGFVSEQGLGALESTHSNVVVGTPAFMAPEQAQAAKPSPASDWYSFGATLYMVLTGTPPFSGLPLPEMLHAKQNTRPPPPRRMVRGIPADLDELCTALLDPDPGNRPGEQQIVDTLLGKGASVRPAAVRGAVAHVASGKRGDFIGRKAELDQLRAALVKTQTGQTQAVEICGRAGMGKTALVRKFTQMVGDAGEAIIIKTRCYERDSLEFKVIDGLVDAVIRNLRQRDKAEVRALLPPDTEALVQMFPALLQVRAFKPVAE